MLRLFRTSLLLACLMPVATAHADSSCRRLFSYLGDKTLTKFPPVINVLWTTNYFVPERKARFVAWHWLVLKRVGIPVPPVELYGSGERNMKVVKFLGDSSSELYDRAEQVSLRIRADGMIMLNDQYGPYDPTCTMNRFAIVNTKDSIETFNFNVEPRIIR